MKYDIIIIGCGPAGMTSAIYALRSGKSVLILEKESIGGQIASSPLVENYPGCAKISGAELSNNLYEQVLELGGVIELEEVTEIKVGKEKEIITTDNTYKCNAIIIASGAKHRLLGLENEVELIGNGIHFCASCDAPFYKNKKVCVVGGGNSAITNAIALSDVCKEVIIVQDLEDLTCEKKLKDKLQEKENITIYYNSKVKKIVGEDELEKIVIENDKETELDIDGMFISIGLIPQSNFIKNLIKTNNYNYIESNDCNTNIDGIFVAGDVRSKKIRQLTTAVNDGTIAALEAVNYIDNLK